MSLPAAPMSGRFEALPTRLGSVVALRERDPSAAPRAGAGSAAGGAGGTGDACGTGAVSETTTVRTITVGVSLAKGDFDGWKASLDTAKSVLAHVKQRFEDKGVVVQTVRVTTNPFEEYLSVRDGWETAVKPALARLTSMLSDGDIGMPVLLSVGPATTTVGTSIIPRMIAEFNVTCSAAVGRVAVGDHWIPDLAMAEASANIIASIAHDNPEGNFNFAATFNCQPGIPFFPAGYHRGPLAFAIGLQCPDLVVAACEGAGQNLSTAMKSLSEAMTAVIRPLEIICQSTAVKYGIQYNGVDASIAPSPDAPSLVRAYEAFGFGKFGGPGCVGISAAITQCLKSLPVKICGYSGLMLPPLEDTGLAARASEGTYRLNDLMTYSSVCGLGLDTVPIPGDTPARKVMGLMLDLCTMAFRVSLDSFFFCFGPSHVPLYMFHLTRSRICPIARWVKNLVRMGSVARLASFCFISGIDCVLRTPDPQLSKPLSCRLFPVPGKSAGDVTEFKNPHMCNGAVFELP